jgi:hypothetical protein
MLGRRGDAISDTQGPQDNIDQHIRSRESRHTQLTGFGH